MDSNDGRKSEWYIELLEKAKQEFPNKVIDIRDMQVTPQTGEYRDWFYGPVNGKVVDFGGSPETQSIESLSKAMDKVLHNVR